MINSAGKKMYSILGLLERNIDSEEEQAAQHLRFALTWTTTYIEKFKFKKFELTKPFC